MGYYRSSQYDGEIHFPDGNIKYVGSGHYHYKVKMPSRSKTHR